MRKYIEALSLVVFIAATTIGVANYYFDMQLDVAWFKGFALDFVQDFWKRILAAAVFCLFLIQIVRGIMWIWNCAFVGYVRRAVWHGLEVLAKTHKVCELLVWSIVRFYELLEVFYIGYHQIDRETSAEENGEKIRANFLRGLVHDLLSYPVGIFCLTVVGILVDRQWEFHRIFYVVWAIDIVMFLMVFVGCERSGEDMSLGIAFRSGWDDLYTASKSGAWLYLIWRYAVAVTWDGPSQIVYFYHYELDTIPKKIIMGLFLTIFEGLFWTYTYSIGHHTFIARAMNYLAG